MQLIRTSLRIKKELKKQAERIALEEDTSLQTIFNLALEQYLEAKSDKRAKKLVFRTHNLGTPLDNLTRDDIYDTFKV